MTGRPPHKPLLSHLKLPLVLNLSNTVATLTTALYATGSIALPCNRTTRKQETNYKTEQQLTM